MNDATAPEVTYEYTPNLPGLLAELKLALLFSTYQAGQIVSLSADENQALRVGFTPIPHPMGIASNGRFLAVGEKEHIRIDSLSKPFGPSTILQSPQIHHTGNILVHELAWCSDELWAVNTLHSSLCTLDGDQLIHRWQPPFVTSLAPEDRCHLNGLCVIDGRPRFATSLGQTDTPAGWRERKADSGCLIDIERNEVILDRLSMPHSPRWYGNQLWLLNSGCGEFGYVDLKTGRYEPVEFMPGYTRGLAFHDHYAFVGLSMIRESNLFGGIPIARDPTSLHCGIGIIDLYTGRTSSVFQFHNAITELFAIEILH